VEHLLSSWGYVALFVLTAIESCCIPLPSEITVGYAGVLSAEHHLQIVLVIIIATLGEVTGSFAAWAIGRSGGRALVERYGKYLLLTHADLDRAEAWVDKRGEWGILVGRVVPLVRIFISLPAGVAEMKPLKFGIFTAAGSLVWISTLATIGYSLAGSWQSIAHDFQSAGYVVAALAILGIAGVAWHRIRAVRLEREGMANTSGGLAAGQSRPGATMADPTKSVDESPSR
jgi:membrane protein DedA with SNARE-associated domain